MEENTNVIKLNYREADKKTLSELLREEGYYLRTDCNGNGTCGKCRVCFHSHAPLPVYEEKLVFTEKELEAGWRLACKNNLTGNREIQLDGRTLERQERQETETGDAFSRRADSKGKKTEGAEKVPKKKAALDIGTTTLAAVVVDSHRGEDQASNGLSPDKRKTSGKIVTSVNHQNIFGADVISRIHAANEGKGPKLQEIIKKDIEDLLIRLGLSMENTELYVSCNTAMGHILQGYSCQKLGKAPYTPIDISYHSYGGMEMLPGISAFVGADIVSGILACGMERAEKVSFFSGCGN